MADAACQGSNLRVLDVPRDEQQQHCVFHSVWGQVDFSILLFDLGAHGNGLVWANAAAESLLISIAPHLEGRELFPLLVPDPGCLACAPSSRRMLELRLGPMVLGYSFYYTAESRLVVLLRDITEQRRLESIAESANLMENIGYVFGGIRHELGNPINTIKMTLSVVQRNLATLTQAQLAEHLERSLEEIGRVEYLLTTLKGFTLYESPDTRPTPLMNVLTHFAHMVGSDLRRRGIELALPELDAGVEVSLDARCMHQVLLNLVTNAADALRGRPAPRIALTAALHSSQVLLEVRDNGVGIAAGQMPHLFHPFWTTKPNGTGLGLVIVKKMLTSMGASIEVASEEGQGTTVTLRLARAFAPEPQAESPPSELPP